jgi:hypothetical protein
MWRCGDGGAGNPRGAAPLSCGGAGTLRLPARARVLARTRRGLLATSGTRRTCTRARWCVHTYENKRGRAGVRKIPRRFAS